VVAMITQEDGEALWIFNIDSSTGKVLAARLDRHFPGSRFWVLMSAAAADLVSIDASAN